MKVNKKTIQNLFDSIKEIEEIYYRRNSQNEVLFQIVNPAIEIKNKWEAILKTDESTWMSEDNSLELEKDGGEISEIFVELKDFF